MSLLLVAAMAAFCSVVSPPAGDDVGDVLWGSRNDTSAFLLQHRLESMGTSVVPDLFEILETGTFDAPSDRRTRTTALQRGAVLSALESMPRAVFRHLELRVREGMSSRARSVSFELLAGLGDSAELELLERVAASAGGRTLPRAARESYRDVLSKFVERDASTTARVQRRFARRHPSLFVPTIEALGRVHRKEVLETLVELLGVVPSVDTFVLREIASTAEELRAPFDDRLLVTVRDYLQCDDAGQVALAARAAGRLGDLQAVPMLIETLDREPTARPAATEALERLSALRLDVDSQAWRYWYEGELRWWTRSGSRNLDVLRSSNSSAILVALRDLSEHRIFRERSVGQILPLLRHCDPGVVEMAAATLGNLGAHEAVPELQTCIEHWDPGVQRTGCAALAQLTGLALPQEPDIWRRYLQLTYD